MDEGEEGVQNEELAGQLHHVLDRAVGASLSGGVSTSLKQGF